MINYVFMNDKYWQKGRLIGIYNKDQYLFEVDGRNENITNENLRLTIDGPDGISTTLHEIFPNIFIEVTVTNSKGNYATVTIPSGPREYPSTKLTRKDKLQKVHYLYVYFNF
jgi:hypothetical protein